MNGVAYLAWRYLAHHRLKTGVLVGAIALVLWLPGALQLLVDRTAEYLAARARQTPLLIGAPGSRLELVLNSLYLNTDPPAPLPFSEVGELGKSGLADAIPLYVRHHASGFPIVGTSLRYLDFRGLRIATGRRIALLGEAMIGAGVAAKLKLGVGDFITSDAQTVFDMAGVYPLRMRIVGVLAPAMSPDDEAVIVDIKTAWVIDGLGHGHQDLGATGSAAQVLKTESSNIVANASVRQYNEITGGNIGSFHFHGDSGGYPLTAIIAIPKDHKSGVILRGRVAEAARPIQIVKPVDAVEELLLKVFSVRRQIQAALLMVAFATLSVAALVFWLSQRMRLNERETLTRIGAGRLQVGLLMVSEIVLVLLAGAALAALLTWITQAWGIGMMQAIMLNMQGSG